jgi:hypothetical protein
LRRPLVLAHVTQRVDAAARPPARRSVAPCRRLSAAAAVEAADLLGDVRRHVHQRSDVTLALRKGRTADELAALAASCTPGPSW